MRGKIAVIGNAPGALEGVQADVVHVDAASFADAAGAHVVVLAEGADVAAVAQAAALRAPAAVLLVVTSDPEGDVARALEASLLPRPRIAGLVPEDLGRAVQAVLTGREETLQAAVQCRGELGIEDRVATVPVRVGARGVVAIGPRPAA